MRTLGALVVLVSLPAFADTGPRRDPWRYHPWDQYPVGSTVAYRSKAESNSASPSYSGFYMVIRKKDRQRVTVQLEENSCIEPGVFAKYVYPRSQAFEDLVPEGWTLDGSGAEVLIIKGKRIPCRWIRFHTWLKGDYNLLSIWLNPQVPTRIVRRVQYTGYKNGGYDRWTLEIMQVAK